MRTGTRISSGNAPALSYAEDAICEAILLRLFHRLDVQFPSLVRTLFGAGSLADMQASDQLRFSVNNGVSEPAVNLYGEGGREIRICLIRLSNRCPGFEPAPCLCL